MLEGIFGNITIEKILFTLSVYGEGYPLGMAKTFGEPVNRFQQQLRRLENSGIVVCSVGFFLQRVIPFQTRTLDRFFE